VRAPRRAWGRYPSGVPLDVVVPDLLPPPEKDLRLPALERWLARAPQVRRPEAGLVELLASSYALPSPPPVAAVSLFAEAGVRDGHWLRADPVHVRAGRDAITMHHASGLEATRGEAQALVAALQSLFASDGFEFRAPSPERWYVRVPAREVPRTTSLDEALRRSVFGLLPRGTGSVNWPSAITEAQMLLTGHEVNAAREARGLPAINGVWFWGEGALPASVARPYALVYAADPFARGLAALSGARAVEAVPAIAALDAVRPEETVLVILDGPMRAQQRGDAQAWSREAQALDDGWFVNLAEAVERFGAVRIILPTGRDTLVAQVTGSTRWRWFRRGKPLASHA
jgi:hypothetical protein